ncbi:DUF6597 domain-containing transcriptional factor [Dactylosporangium sp. CA-052675]|uniref:DUF6597 domain-containing transcriptional factor n=1 Tax=Dactylosporangium sp. CA-052675 TaxID=3239927 RepID=UPI003D92156A
MQYVSRVPRPPLDRLIDDLYYLEGSPPYARLTLPPMPAALLIVNLGAPLRIRAGTDIETAEYADGCVVTMPTRAYDFGYPPRTRSVGAHVKPWGLAPFLPVPAAEPCDRPVTVEQVWGRPAVAELRDRLATAHGPHEMLTLLEEELMRRLRETAGLGLVRHTSGVIRARYFGETPKRRRVRWARWSCTARCRWTASSRTSTTSPDRCSTGCPAATSRWTRAAR